MNHRFITKAKIFFYVSSGEVHCTYIATHISSVSLDSVINSTRSYIGMMGEIDGYSMEVHVSCEIYIFSFINAFSSLFKLKIAHAIYVIYL